MFATTSLFAIIFIVGFMSMVASHPYDPIFKYDAIRQYNQTTTKMPSERNTNITCNACKRRANFTKNVHKVIIDPITVVPVFQHVPQVKKVQKKAKPQAEKKSQKKVQSQVQKKAKPAPQPSVDTIQDKPTTYLRNGYYSQPILKTYLRGTPLVQNLATYNPPDRYCYSIMSSIKSIVGI